MKQRILMLQGLPGSGKSTFAKKSLADSNNYKRVNRDLLREMLDDGVWTEAREKLIRTAELTVARAILGSGKSVIVDDTNLSESAIKMWEKLAESYQVKLDIKLFDTPLDQCIANDLKRADSVGETVIRQMHERYVRPTLKVEQNPSLDDAAIFDLDGTLALMGDRNPYNAAECEYDKLNHPVYEELMRCKASGYKIIICSGRSSEFLKQTDRWLGKHMIMPDLFLMRKQGDTRSDSIVKREMFMNEILPRYYVNVVFDDRQRVVDAWRDLGLTVFQVAEGHF